MSDEVETTRCPTCLQDVPSANMEMHSIHCKRFLTLCPHCKESVNKNMLEEHIEENHAKVKCDACKESVEKMDMESHKESSCSQRTVNCPYCEISLSASDMTDHKDSCGSRTDECELCHKRILIRDMEYHIANGCQQSAIEPYSAAKHIISKGPPRNTARNTTGFRKMDHKFQDHKPNGVVVGSLQETGVVFDDKKIAQNGRRKADSKDDDAGVSQTLGFVKSNPTSKSLDSRFRDAGKVSSKAKLVNGSRKTAAESVPVKKKTEHQKTKAELPDFGIPDPDSDSDAEAQKEEKFPSFDLSETFLPCEFCGVQFPADTLSFHQATCERESTSPWPAVQPQESPFPSSPKRPHESQYDTSSFTNERSFHSSAQEEQATGTSFTSERSFHSSAQEEQATGTSFTSERSFHSSAQEEQATGTYFESNTKDLGGESGPCQFCNKLFPFDILIVHQRTCSENSGNFNTDDLIREDLYQPPTLSLPTPTPRNSRSPRPANQPQPAKPKPTSNRKQRLAPAFKDNRSTLPNEGSSGLNGKQKNAKITPPVPAENFDGTKLPNKGPYRTAANRTGSQLTNGNQSTTKGFQGAQPKFHEVNRLGNGSEPAHSPHDVVWRPPYSLHPVGVMNRPRPSYQTTTAKTGNFNDTPKHGNDIGNSRRGGGGNRVGNSSAARGSLGSKGSRSAVNSAGSTFTQKSYEATNGFGDARLKPEHAQPYEGLVLKGLSLDPEAATGSTTAARGQTKTAGYTSGGGVRLGGTGANIGGSRGTGSAGPRGRRGRGGSSRNRGSSRDRGSKSTQNRAGKLGK